VATQLRILRSVHLTHAALAEQAHDAKMFEGLAGLQAIHATPLPLSRFLTLFDENRPRFAFATR
jgi:hypothetical protein